MVTGNLDKRSPLRVLHVEDVEDDAILIAHALRRGGFAPTCRRVETAATMREALNDATWDLVLSDFSLPGFDAPAALSVLHQQGADVPFIIVSGTISEDAAVAAMKAGAHDWVMKGNLQRLVPAVSRELREAESRRERRRAEERGRRAEAHFRSLVDSIEGIVFTVDHRYMIEGAFGRGLGVGDVHQLLEDAADVPFYAACARAFAGERVIHEWTQRVDGDTRYLQLQLSPIVAPEAPTLGLIGLVTDTTAQKQLQAQLLLSDRMASLGGLAASVGHEINNPLAALMANLDVAAHDLYRVANGTMDGDSRSVLAQAQESLGDAREAAQRVRQVVRDLNVVSRASDERRVPVSIQHVLESSVRMAWNEIRHRAQLVWELAPVPAVLASESRLGQVFLNLLVNAAQAIPPGDTEGNQIRVATRMADPGRVVVEIEDSGLGIPPSVMERLFTPFVSTKPEGTGTGLGLSICHRIVTGFGGTIVVESREGHGTTVRVELPAAGVGEAPEEARAGSEIVRAPRRGRVLVVDDEAMIQRAIQRTLSPDHDVTAVGGGERALRLLQEGKRFDVILCDLMMPEMSGMELHARVSELAPDQAERMIFLTGGVFSDDARLFLDAMPNLKLDKPFEASVLLDAVAERIG